MADLPEDDDDREALEHPSSTRHHDEDDEDDEGPRPRVEPDLLDHVDPSIVQLPVFWDQPQSVAEPLYLWHYRGLPSSAKTAFWDGLARRSRDLPIRGFWLNQNPFVKTLPDLAPVGRDFMILSDERIDELQRLQTVNIDTRNVIVPWSVNEHMAEQVPQFTLRNIARLERDDTVERGVQLEHEPPAMSEAAEQLAEVRNPYIPRPEMPDSWSAPLFEDFRTFLEEVLHLCPWAQMPTERKVPSEDSLWHPSHSRSNLTHELLERRKSVFVFGQRGGPQQLLRERQERVYTAKSITPPPLAATPQPPADGSDERMG